MCVCVCVCVSVCLCVCVCVCVCGTTRSSQLIKTNCCSRYESKNKFVLKAISVFSIILSLISVIDNSSHNCNVNCSWWLYYRRRAECRSIREKCVTNSLTSDT